MDAIWCDKTHIAENGQEIAYGQRFVVNDFEHKYGRALTISLVGFNQVDKPGLFIRFAPSSFRTPDGLSVHRVKAKPKTEAFDRYGEDELFIYDLRPGDHVLCRPFGKAGRPHPHLRPLSLRQFIHLPPK